MKFGSKIAAVRQRFVVAVLAVWSAFDMNDVYFWAGLVGLWFGCRAVYEPSAPIVCGGVLLAVGLVGAFRGGMKQ